jgi:ABC-type bacteriocin/lantibiotic exporter with double-glycine peptidase domain
MVYCGLTQDTDWNPYQMAQKAEREGYYVSGCGSSWEMMTGLAGELGLTAKTVIFDEDHIKEELNAGRPIICAMGPGDFTTTGHFIVLTGVNADGSIAVNDPNSRENSRTDWDLQTIMSQTRNLWSYTYEG